ncbi:MAG: ribonuclease D [Alphaproteobacteria bacterium]|nr:ribonuclease D [Alphaproteobacteria bacterium]
MSISLYKNDLPDGLDLGTSIAVDSETMGLNPVRDRLCVLQLSTGDGKAHLVQFTDPSYDAPNLKAALANPEILKIFHFARFDIAVIKKFLGVETTPIYCTKIASKLVRTYTDKHGLSNICRELIGIELNKQQQSSDWGAAELTAEQLSYAANDVLYLHKLKERLDVMLERENRTHLAQDCFNFLSARAQLDLSGWADQDIFEH